MKIPLKNIICDIQGRTNQDVTELSRQLLVIGQKEPILVEGPDELGNYYLIHGYLRYHAMLQNKQHFQTAECSVISELTSQQDRTALRLMLTTSAKKSTRLDQQLLYEDIEEYEDREHLIPRGKLKRIERGGNVPQELRIKYEKKRRSQEALALIYEQEELRQYREYLLKELYEGRITTIHSDAIKKVISHPKYQQLEYKQKIMVIERARKEAKFTSNGAGMIIFQEVMKEHPTKENIQDWLEYLCEEIDKLSESIHDDLKDLVEEKHQSKIRSSLDGLNTKLKWIVKDTGGNVEEKEVQWEEKGSEMNDKDNRNLKRQTIIMEKRNGNKYTFYFH